MKFLNLESKNKFLEVFLNEIEYKDLLSSTVINEGKINALIFRQI